jgi:hypothetical protein
MDECERNQVFFLGPRPAFTFVEQIMGWNRQSRPVSESIQQIQHFGEIASLQINDQI